MDDEIIIPRSPSVAKRLINHRIEVEDEIRHNTYESCCLKIDKNMLQYIVQQITIVGLMIFCINRIIYLPSCEASEWVSFLTFLVGISIPNPKLKIG